MPRAPPVQSVVDLAEQRRITAVIEDQNVAVESFDPLEFLFSSSFQFSFDQAIDSFRLDAERFEFRPASVKNRSRGAKSLKQFGRRPWADAGCHIECDPFLH